MNSGLAAPIIIPFATAAVVLLGRHQPTFQHVTSILAAALHLAIGAWLLNEVHHSGIQVLHVAAWPAPFGIALVADHLSALMVVITGVIYTAVSVYSRGEINADLRRRGYYPLLHILVGGISGAFLTGDLFNLYVWFEVMLMASFALLVMGKTRAQLDGGVKYVVINLISTLLFLTGLGLVYGMTGTLNMAHLHVKLKMVSDPGLVAAVAVLFLTAFGIKSGSLSPVFLATGLLPHAACSHVGHFCRTADQGGRLRADSNLHPDFSIRRQRSAGAGPGGSGSHHDRRRFRCCDPLPHPPNSLVPHHQPGRLYDFRVGTLHPVGPGRCGYSTCFTTLSSKPICF